MNSTQKPKAQFIQFEAPIRGEILTGSRLENQAEHLVQSHTLTENPSRGRSLRRRISQNRKILEKAYVDILKSVNEERAITPAGEWMIDNFHIVRAQLKDIHDHLPPGFYRKLPKLNSGPLKGFPRVYSIAWSFVEHTDSHFDADLLKKFLSAYQKHQPLSIGEMWAVPVTLRVVLIENLRRLALRIVAAQVDRKEADRIANEVLGLGEQASRPLTEVIAELDTKKFSVAFMVQLLQRLRFQDVNVDLLLSWMHQVLTLNDFTEETAVSQEHTAQTIANATVRNIITSARLISAYNWQNFFEDVSVVDAELRKNPTYALLDFDTRDRYRHGLEQLSSQSQFSEIEIARKVVEKTAAFRETPTDPRGDLGYYFIGVGRRNFEKEISYRTRLKERLGRSYLETNTELYLGGLLIVTLLLLALPMSLTRQLHLSPATTTAFMILGFFLAAEVALALVNRITVGLLGPQHLPRLDLEKKFPESLKTFVVVPTFLLRESQIRAQIEQLEIHYLANPIEHVHFALLTDWSDAGQEEIPQDRPLLHFALQRLEELNRKYPRTGHRDPRFFIFHRKRLYNPQEGKWIGWERKRGKLHEFNKLLLGASETSFMTPNNTPLSVPSDVRYVITLDADTRMPKGAVAQLVGALAHPLNKARYSPDKKRVVEGYGVLQPRVTPTLPTAEEGTLFQSLLSGPSGVDPYATAVSDVYQDLFSEGSFSGKGIYEVATFEQALAGKIPENSLLSHDLFEGVFARCGFLSDIEFFEDFPSHVNVAAARNHRWIRGDWQLLPWILGRAGNSIPLIGRWKMVDNLRRSLFAPMVFAIFILALCQSAPTAALWMGLAVLSLSIPTLIVFFTDIPSKRRGLHLLQHLRFTFSDLRQGLQRLLLTLTLLPQQAFLNLDAIVRALYRLCISGRHRLEWTAAAQVKNSAHLNVLSFFQNMTGGFFLTTLAFSAVAMIQPYNLLFGFVLFALWWASPFYAWLISTPTPKKHLQPLSASDTEILSLTARRTWLFFATFVGDEDNHLPPDNFQETPAPVVAHRSSPTNFGLYLLSVLTANDFGWIGRHEVLHRIEKTLHSLKALPKHEGHMFNWYDTTNLHPLEPRYISSVDNGNLAGHLIALAQGLQDLLRHPVEFHGFLRGVQDSLVLLKQALQKKMAIQNGVSVEITAFLENVSSLETFLLLSHEEIDESAFWNHLKEQSTGLLNQIKNHFPENLDKENKEILAWAQALHSDIYSQAEDFENLLSWRDVGFEEWPREFKPLQMRLKETIPLQSLPQFCGELLVEIQILLETSVGAENLSLLEDLRRSLMKSQLKSEQLILRITQSQALAYELFHEMDFSLLYDATRKLFSIGLRVADNNLDASYYDLLASESRLLSFVAIAKGDVPVSHWFSLGRSLAQLEKGSALISWSGSMFEYLMPSLVMNTPEGGLLKQTCILSVQKQIKYGADRSVPWGVSESAYNKRDLHLTYQYSNFGVPDLALKRGLEANLVVAPYATLLASMFAPVEAALNLKSLKSIDGAGLYGFYEAIDFTESRLPEGKTYAVIQAYMAHHQGMSLVALGNVFKENIMCRRFHTEPLVQATELLLQERTPRAVGVLPTLPAGSKSYIVREEIAPVVRLYHTVHRPTPRTQLLSNGNYSVMLTSAGSGYSQYKNTAITRWREDVTQDHWGQYFFIRDLRSKKIWSATYQPTRVSSEKYEVNFSEDRVRFHREDENIQSDLEIFVSPENQTEIRRLTLMNHDTVTREIEITSYCEVVLNSQGADIAHPAFSNLFVQTEYIAETQTLLAKRRPRSAKDKELWMAHVVTTDGYKLSPVDYETDRSHFLGRGRNIQNAQVIYDDVKMSKTLGPVLDPVLSLRLRLRLPPGSSTSILFANAVADTREEVTRLTENLHDSATYDRISTLAWTQAQVKLQYLNIEPDEAHLFQRLASRLLYLDSTLRPTSAVLKKNTRDLNSLWAHGISGDSPLIVVRIQEIEDRAIVRQLIKAQEYLALKRLVVDLVIMNAQASSYSQELQNTLEAMSHAGGDFSPLPQSRGKIFVLREDLLSQEDRLLIYSEARVFVSANLGGLSEQVERTLHSPQTEDPIQAPDLRTPFPALPAPKLEFFNGLGGFTPDAKEYVIVLNQGSQNTPAPWINVISNGSFGFQVSESGSGYTWSLNSRENQITPWSNDPVSDPAGEAFYVLDEATGNFWSPTPLPIRLEKASYMASHGQGYSRFEHFSHDIHSTLTQFVPMDRPVKISKWKLENKSTQVRRLSLFGYVDWVLGFARSTMAPTTVTELDEASGLIHAWNPRSHEFGRRFSFAGFLTETQSVTGDRREFIGRNGSLKAPAALFRKTPLTNRTGASLDPCAAFKTQITLNPGESLEVEFVLGQVDSREEARELKRHLQRETTAPMLQAVRDYWDEVLEKVQVETPDKAFDFMLNRWLLYQNIVCRYWSRSAFYQAGGAYGFRDQLQDVMAMTLTRPKIAREHILRAAARQFVEGDVQHWWHPPSGRGVRTHFSDDLLWLPYVVHYYIDVTQDYSILEEEVSFIQGPLLREDQEDSYYTPEVSPQRATLYDHCARALDHSLRTGIHDLPLIGAGDWNDGMNRVGHAGKGESVWLAWFLILNIAQFGPIAETRGELDRAQKWFEHLDKIKSAVEVHAWDGDWYRRAFYDDGSPLGSISSGECQIDSLAQTWAVISGAADPDRAQQAMASVDQYLVKPEERLILLFTPPFDKTPHDPGYIKGYLPGVRENGGQYTHAASWAVVAWALLGEGAKAVDYFKLINPIYQAQDLEAAKKYKIEPYVMAGDIYSQAPHTGRGGWSWYTGSCGWVYRSGLESILGLKVRGPEIFLDPQIPDEWKNFKITYKFGRSVYNIHVENHGGRTGRKKLTVDGIEMLTIPLEDDGRPHDVKIILKLKTAEAGTTTTTLA